MRPREKSPRPQSGGPLRGRDGRSGQVKGGGGFARDGHNAHDGRFSRDNRFRHDDHDTRDGRFSRDGRRANSAKSEGRARTEARPGRGIGEGRVRQARPQPFRNEAQRERAFEPPSIDAIWGRRPILEALRAGRPVDKIFTAENLRPGAAGEIEHLAAERGVPVQKASRRRLEELAGGETLHQGFVAVLPAAPYADLDDIIAAPAAGKPVFVVVLDGIQDPQNLGSILRTAETAGAGGVIIPKRRAVGLTGIVAKASAGAVAHLPVARVGNVAQTIEELKERGVWVIGADAAARDLVWDVDLTGPIAVVVGAEGEGLSRLVKERCDLLVRLPVLGKVESLNASVAAGIIMYEVVRQRESRRVKNE